jgi:hypothetical protein
VDNQRVEQAIPVITQRLRQPLVGLHVLFVALTSLLTSVVVSPLVVRFPWTDSGVFLYIGWRILNGNLPYQDIWDHKGPVLYFINVVGLAFGGGSVWGVWAIQLLALAITFAVLYYLTKTWFGPLAPFVAMIFLFLSFEPFLDGGNLAELYALPLTVLIYFCFYRSVKMQNTFRYPFIIGVLGGLAFMLRPNLMGAMLVAGGSFFIIGLLNKQVNVNLKRIAGMLVGFLLTLTLWALALLAIGVLDEFIQQTFVYNLSYSTGGDMGNRMAALKQALLALKGGKYAAFLVLVSWTSAGIWLFISLFHQHSLTAKMQGLLFVFLVLPFEMIMSLISGRPYLHYFILWLPAIALLFSALTYLALFLPARKWPVIYQPIMTNSVVIVLIISLLGKGVDLYRGLNSFPAVDRRNERQNLRMVDYIVKNTSPEDEVLVWGGNAGLNFHSSRAAPTRFVYQFQFFDKEFTNLEWAEEFADSLAENLPLLILDYGFDKGIPPLDLESQDVWLDDHKGQEIYAPVQKYFQFVSANYQLCTTIENVGMYWRDGCP